ncbi:MAG: hypothetical protein AAGM04_04200 [Pseudomonadota bacterium]
MSAPSQLSLFVDSDGNSDSAERQAAIAAYQHLTQTVLPHLARSGQAAWPVREDHCFQRIVLDAICGGPWYDHIKKPAYQHLTRDQALAAVALCHDVIEGRQDLAALNQNSLRWRGKLKSR